MGLEKRFIEQDTVLDKVAFPAVEGTDDESYDMSVRDYVVRPSNHIDDSSAGGTLTINLPPVAEARGRTYSIVARTILNDGGGADGNVVITGQGDSEQFGGDYTMTAAGDMVVLYSDGFTWIPLVVSTT